MRVALALGADLSDAPLPEHRPAHPGPLRRTDARGCSCASAIPAGTPFPEMLVHRPARGSIDLGLHEPRERLLVASELQSELRRLEQLVRWSRAEGGGTARAGRAGCTGRGPGGLSAAARRAAHARDTQVAAQFAAPASSGLPGAPRRRRRRADRDGRVARPGARLGVDRRPRDAVRAGSVSAATLLRPSQPQQKTNARMTTPRTLVEKIWDDHVVTQDPGAPAVLAIDLHLVHEVTSPQAFTGLRTRGIGVRRPDKTVATADHGTPDDPARPPDHGHAGRGPDRPARDELPRLRHPAPRVRQRHPGDRPCHRPGARAHATGHDDRVRRLAHGDPRRVRGARVRHRDERGRDGPRDPDPAPAPAEDLRGARRRTAQPGRLGEGHHPRAHRPDRHRRRHRACVRVPRRGHPRAVDGTADDDLQHEHRGRGAGRARRPGRHDIRVRPRPPARPAGCRVGRGGRPLAAAARPTTAPPSTSRW